MTDDQKTILSLLGFVFLRNARAEKAVIVLAALDALQPGQPRTLRSLALAQLRTGKPDRALRTLDRLAMSGQVDAAFHLLRSQALLAAGRTQESHVAMRTHVQLRQAQATTAPATATHRP